LTLKIKIQEIKMLKKMMTQVLALAMISLLFSSEVFSQTRINFRRGSTSASVSGSLAPGAARSFVLTAKSGQNLRANISSGSGNVRFSDPEGPGTLTSIEYVTESGDNAIYIANNGKKATNFTLTVSIAR
jgi:hypothetical protein